MWWKWLYWQPGQTSLKRRTRKLYMVTKKLSNKFQHIDNPVNDYNGNPLTTSKKQLKRWVEHFVELLNKLTSETSLHIQPANTDKPSKTDIRRRINTFKNRRATGSDKIPTEAIKDYTKTAVFILHNIYETLWNNKKKASLLSCQRKEIWGTALSTGEWCSCLCLTSEVLSRILLEKMRKAVDSKLRNKQAALDATDLYQLQGQQESIRQRGLGGIVEDSVSLWKPGKLVSLICNAH